MTQEPPKDDVVDPLAAMAAGEDLNEVDPYLEQQVKAERSLLGLPEEEEAAPAAQPAAEEAPAEPAPVTFVPAAPTAASSAAAARASADRARAQAAQAMAASVQYKKFMVPILLGVGLVLVAIGAFVWFVNPLAMDQVNATHASDGVSDEPTNHPGWAVTMVSVMKFCAIPLGLLLLVGSIYFHLDVQKTLKRIQGR